MTRLDLTRKKTPLEKRLLVRMADHSGNPMVNASVMRSDCWKKLTKPLCSQRQDKWCFIES